MPQDYSQEFTTFKTKDTEHIRPLWVAQSKRIPSFSDWLWSRYRSWLQHPTSSQSSTIIWPWMTRPARQAQRCTSKHMEDSLYTVLGSCVLHLHIDNKVFPTVFEVTNMTGPVILGRIQAKAMGYIQFPQIWWPHALTAFPDTSRKLMHTLGHPHQRLHSTAMHISPQRLNPKSPYTKPDQQRITQSKAGTTDYRTSTTTHKMEHRLHTTQW